MLGYQLPAYTTRWCGAPLLERLQRLIIDLKREGDFISMSQLSL